MKSKKSGQPTDQLGSNVAIPPEHNPGLTGRHSEDDNIRGNNLEEVQQLLHFTEELTNTGSWCYTLKNHHLLWTPQVYRIHEMDDDLKARLSGEELIAQSVNCYLDEDRIRIQEAFDLCCSQGVPYQLECRFTTLKGKKRWIRTIGKPIYNEGVIVSVAGHIQDITEEKNRALALEESESKFRTLVDQAGEMLFLHDLNGRILDVNLAAVRQTGYSREELLGMTVFDLDAQAEVRNDPSAIWDKVTELGPVTLEVEHQRKGGSSYMAEVTIGPVFIGGKQRILALARDVSDRKRVEKQLEDALINARAIMDASVDVLILLNSDGIVIDTNEAHARRFGISRDAMVGKHISSFLPPDLAEDRMNRVRQVIETRQPITGEDERDGKWNKYWIHPVFEPGGMVHKVAVYADDISQQKNHLAQIEAQNKQLTELNALKDKLNAIIAHDLRAPFNNILGFTQILAEDATSMTLPEIGAISRQLSKSASSYYQLLENLLTWSQIQLGVQQAQVERRDLQELVLDSIVLFEEQAGLKGIKIVSSIAPELMIKVDVASLQSVLRNLVSNALKFSKENSVVQISATRMTGCIEVQVTDFGVGVDPDMLDNLFRIDRKTSSRGTHGEPGSGLGLLITKELVEKWGGQIRVESKYRQGSIFAFTIPV